MVGCSGSIAEQAQEAIRRAFFYVYILGGLIRGVFLQYIKWDLFLWGESVGLGCACIVTGLLFVMPGDDCGGNGFVPVVPYASYSEYEEMLESLIVAYEAMVVDAFSGRDACWSRYSEAISRDIEEYWWKHGRELFLKFTKGMGDDWCDTMNTMVVHVLGTAIRVLIQTLKMKGMKMDDYYEDREHIRGLLKRETRLAIFDNMGLFKEYNFLVIWKNGDMGDYDRIPIALAGDAIKIFDDHPCERTVANGILGNTKPGFRDCFFSG